MTADGPRANPFLRPSETTLRFLLLALVTAAAALNAWQYVAFVLFGDRFLEGMTRCNDLDRTRAAPPFSSEHARCWAESVANPLAVVMGAGLLITLAVTALAWLLTPIVRTRLDRCYAAPPSLRAELEPEIADVAAALDVTPPPLVLRPAAGASAQVVGGGFGVPRLVLTEPMVVVRAQAPARFRAVVAHELGHLRNRDVRLVEAANASWWALLVAVVLPYALAALSSGFVVSAVPILAKLLVTLGLVRLLRSALLRAREHDADLWASTVDGVGAGLTAIFDHAPELARRPRLLRSHPPPSRRSLTIRHPDRILRTSALDLVSLTTTGYLLLSPVSFWLTQISYGRSASPVLAAVTSWGLGIALGVGVWVLAWREAVGARVTGRRRPVVLAGAAALAAGVLLGSFLVAVPQSGVAGLAVPVTLGQGVVVAAALVISAVLVQGLATLLARRVAGAAPHRRSGGAVGRWPAALTVVATTALTVDAGSRLTLFTVPEIPALLGLLGTALSMLLDASTWVIAVAALGALIATVMRTRSRSTVVPDWMLLPPTGPTRPTGTSGPTGAAAVAPWEGGPRA